MNIKLSWPAVGVLITFTALILGWAWSIESRLGKATDFSGRLQSIEEALYPILVDYRVNQIVEERLHNHVAVPDDPTPPDEPPVHIVGAPLNESPETKRHMETIHNEAEDWAKQQLPRRELSL